MTFNTKVLFAIVFVLILSIYCFAKTSLTKESFGCGYYPAAVDNVLAPTKYPRISHNGISNNGSADIWWHYPTFALGNYEQITNNLRYPNNPDEGTCMPASMCGALYHESAQKNTPSNIVKPLKPLQLTSKSRPRVGYFYSDNSSLFLN